MKLQILIDVKWLEYVFVKTKYLKQYTTKWKYIPNPLKQVLILRKYLVSFER
jgi:hypothetical protein